ncbi:MAG TPA: hypothetical protein VF787_06885 [Thermoanaerobaculia bacterium]
MKVADVAALQSRYARISDRFKATWTAHQFVSGAYRHLLSEPLPYELDFDTIYDRVKNVAATIGGVMRGNVRPGDGAMTRIEEVEELLVDATDLILDADTRIGPSLLRRFFEIIKPQDDAILESLIRFYLFADAVEGDRRDKLDFLFTRVGETTSDSLTLRQRLVELVSALHVADAPRDEVVGLIRAMRSMKEDIESVNRFDDLTERNLVRDARTFKHRVGDLYFDPDVLLAIVDLNVATKNRVARLYDGEEERLVQDADKLMEHGSAIERNFGDANPELIEEIARFRELREQFDSLRAQSNVKHDVVSRLKASMNNILAQLGRGLDSASDEEMQGTDLPPAFFDETQRTERVTQRFGRHEPLLAFVLRLDEAIDRADPAMTPDELIASPEVRDLRLEPWEAAAYQKLIDRRPPEAEEDTEELWLLYVRAAALRLKVDEEATIMATAIAAGVRPENELLALAKRSLDLAKEFDVAFGDFLQEAVYYANRRILHQLYRSRFRLLRGFSGLWLIYDRQS